MIRKPEMFKEAECGRGSKLIIQILIFFAVFMVKYYCIAGHFCSQLFIKKPKGEIVL